MTPPRPAVIVTSPPAVAVGVTVPVGEAPAVMVARLPWATDHPAETEMLVDERFFMEPTEPAFHLTEPPRTVAAARDHLGQDAWQEISTVDGVYLDRCGRGVYQGLTQDHWVEVDLGPNAPDAGPLWLVARGWQLRFNLPDMPSGTIDLSFLRLSGGLESRFLRIAAAFFLVMLALKFYLGRFEMVWNTHRFMVGIDFTDDHYTLPMYWVAIAALLEGRIDAAWARFVRPWVLVAWMCLTLGIAGGSYWAYYELGWGGYWFWDPVENASLMPWLAGTALLHSAVVMEKRGALQTDIDKGGLHARQHARHATLVEIAHQAAAAGALDVQLLHHRVLEHRGARLARGDVDEYLCAHGSARRVRPERHPGRLEQLAGLVERQSHDAGVAAAQVLDEERTSSLHGVVTGLVARLAR